MKVCCGFLFESPHRGDSKEYSQHTNINIKKKITQNYPKYNNVCSYGSVVCKGLKSEFEIALVNEPPAFEPLKFYGTVPTTFFFFLWMYIRVVALILISDPYFLLC